ncbi:MAG: FG-GAP repeat protein [Bdellovibrionaceae bacterium]|nr:FG-GAP repeat protein [Pseudobdellovibrionaceae bacterium]
MNIKDLFIQFMAFVLVFSTNISCAPDPGTSSLQSSSPDPEIPPSTPPTTPPSTPTSVFSISPNADGWMKITGPSPINNSYFGMGIAVGDFDGDSIKDMAAGAYLADIGNSNTDTGAVFIYLGSLRDSSFEDRTYNQTISAPNLNNSQFGFSVLAFDVNRDGFDDLIVGATGEEPSDRGAVYIYYGSTNGLNSTPAQTIVEPTATASSGFGSALAYGDLNNDGFNELIVGAYLDDTTAADAGSFWIFQGFASNIYSTAFATEVRLATGSAADYFGTALAVGNYNGDANLDIFVGVPRSDVNGLDSGSVYVYNGTGSSATWVTSVTVPDASIHNPYSVASDYFGWSLAIGEVTGDSTQDLIVGIPFSDYFGTNQGMAIIYNDIGSNQTANNIIPGVQSVYTTTYSGYGMALADLNGDTKDDFLFGSPLFTGDGGYRQGRIDVYYSNSSGLINFSFPDLIFYAWEDETHGNYSSGSDYFGNGVCGGDINGDGKEDLIVGAPLDDSRYADQGAIYIYLNRESNFLNKPDIILNTTGYELFQKQYGSSCLVMDFDRDGNNDLLVGAQADDIGGTDGGAVFIHFGTGSGLSKMPRQVIVDPGDTSNGFGSAIEAGDINNDGFPDLVIGAYLDDTGGTDKGIVYVYESNNTTGQIDINSYTTFQTVVNNTEWFGAALTIIDFDGDGDNDLLVGAPFNDTAATDSGRVVVYDNPGTVNTLLDNTADSFIYHPTTAANSQFGQGLTTGKLNSSIYKDLIIGAYNDDSLYTNAGAIYIYNGSITGPSATFNQVYQGLEGVDSTSDGFGFSISLIDFNNDGKKDIVIGTPYDDSPGLNVGSVFIKIQ